MKRTFLLVGLLAVSLAPLGASAGHCANKVYVFSYHADFSVAYTPGLVCLAATEEEADARMIEPGSDAVSIRYAADVDAATPTVEATLNGLGFVDRVVPLERTNLGFGGIDVWVYDGPVVSIPDGAFATGCLRVDVELGDEDVTNFHRTVGATC